MRIVHTESSLGWGGQEIRILSESKGLIGRRHDVTVLCPAEARLFEEAPAWGVPAVAAADQAFRFGQDADLLPAPAERGLGVDDPHAAARSAAYCMR